MSHLRTCKLGLKNPNRALLEATFNELATRYNGRIINRVSSYAGSRRVLLGLAGDGFGRGYGITIEADGSVQLHGDQWGHSVKMDQFMSNLTQTYTKLALIQTLQARGYSVSQSTARSGVILIGERP